MAWTYDASPDTTTSAGRRDSVRLLIGDTDTDDQQVQDEEIVFFLSRASNKIYLAAALSARAIAAKYARRVDSEFDEVSSSYSDLQKHYTNLAYSLEAQSDQYDGSSLGLAVGGVSLAVIEANDEKTDRPTPAFRRKQFRNLPTEYDSYGGD